MHSTVAQDAPQIIYLSTPTLQPFVVFLSFSTIKSALVVPLTCLRRWGDASFWTVQLFLDELDNLLTYFKIQDDYDLLGHSWGGMLAASHAIRDPSGLKRLAIMSSPPSMPLWVAEQNKLRCGLPKEVQDIMTKHEEAGTRSMKLRFKSSTNVICAG